MVARPACGQRLQQGDFQEHRGSVQPTHAYLCTVFRAAARYGQHTERQRCGVGAAQKVAPWYHQGNKTGIFLGELVKIARETGQKWRPGVKIVTRDLFRMTLKAILNTSLLNVFEDDDGVDEIIEAYHVCKTEMDARVVHPPPAAGSKRERYFQSNLARLQGHLKKMLQIRQSQSDGKEIPLLDALISSHAPEGQIVSDMVSHCRLLCYLDPALPLPAPRNTGQDL